MSQMKDFFVGVTLLGLAFGFYKYPDVFRTDHADELPANAPEGAVLFYENADETASLTVFDDRVVLSGSAVEGGGGEIPISKIARVRKLGTFVKLLAKNGDEMTVNFTFFGMSAAKEFVDTLHELADEPAGS